MGVTVYNIARGAWNRGRCTFRAAHRVPVLLGPLAYVPSARWGCGTLNGGDARGLG